MLILPPSLWIFDAIGQLSMDLIGGKVYVFECVRYTFSSAQINLKQGTEEVAQVYFKSYEIYIPLKPHHPVPSFAPSGAS